MVFPGCIFHGGTFPPDKISRGAAGAPTRFVFVRTEDLPGDSMAILTCYSPLWDLRGDSTKLTLVRSANGRGDYEVTPLRYGVRENELIRIHCGNGAVVGIVAR